MADATSTDSDETIAKMRSDVDSPWFDRLCESMTDAAPVELLTPCEKRVIQGASFGLTYDMVAEVYGVGVATVRTQATIAMRKLGAKNMAHAVALSLRKGLIQ